MYSTSAVDVKLIWAVREDCTVYNTINQVLICFNLIMFCYCGMMYIMLKVYKVKVIIYFNKVCILNYLASS